jgi:hypothetical protein
MNLTIIILLISPVNLFITEKAQLSKIIDTVNDLSYNSYIYISSRRICQNRVWRDLSRLSNDIYLILSRAGTRFLKIIYKISLYHE